jgi:hypothetical protein
VRKRVALCDLRFRHAASVNRMVSNANGNAEMIFSAASTFAT